MAGWEDVRRSALELPETDEALSRGLRQWRVRSKAFVWERPLRRADLDALGPEAPGGPILGVRVEYAVVLVRLDRIPGEDLDEIVAEAWLAQAPKRLARAFLEQRGPQR